MECDDDTVSPSVFPKAVNTMSCEMLFSSDLDPQRHAIENDCNSNTLCHACGILDDCQCTQQQTDDHNYVSSSIVPIDCTVSMECDDDTVSPFVFSEAVNTVSCKIVHSSDLDPQLNAVENDCNNNTVCHACGILDCQCTQQQIGDHNYASYRPSVRTHKRTGVQLTRKKRKNCSKWKAVKKKKLCQQGKVYVMSTGAMAKAKAVQRCTRDHEDCHFKCATNSDKV